MKQAEEFRSFQCLRMDDLLNNENRQFTEKEALIVEHYCKEILAKGGAVPAQSTATDLKRSCIMGVHGRTRGPQNSRQLPNG